MEQVVCPRCGAEMVARNVGDAEIKQCPDGHGVFLERADLSELINAELAWHSNEGGHHTMPIPRITADMTTPPPPAPRAPAWIATLFR